MDLKTYSLLSIGGSRWGWGRDLHVYRSLVGVMGVATPFKFQKLGGKCNETSQKGKKKNEKNSYISYISYKCFFIFSFFYYITYIYLIKMFIHVYGVNKQDPPVSFGFAAALPSLSLTDNYFSANFEICRNSLVQFRVNVLKNSPS